MTQKRVIGRRGGLRVVRVLERLQGELERTRRGRAARRRA
jgi:hypothetical protein